DGQSKERDIDFPIKINQHMGTDAVIGKATRKARAWLYNTITGSEIGDGDVTEVEGKVISTTINEKKSPQEIEFERIAILIDEAQTKEQLEGLKEYLQAGHKEAFDMKLKSFA